MFILLSSKRLIWFEEHTEGIDLESPATLDYHPNQKMLELVKKTQNKTKKQTTWCQPTHCGPDLENIVCVPRRRVRPLKKKCPRYGTKLHLLVRFKFRSSGLYEITPSFLLLPGPLWPGEVVSFWNPSMGPIDLFENNWYLMETVETIFSFHSFNNLFSSKGCNSSSMTWTGIVWRSPSLSRSTTFLLWDHLSHQD